MYEKTLLFVIKVLLFKFDKLNKNLERYRNLVKTFRLF